MIKHILLWILIIIVVSLGAYGCSSTMGAGALKRHMTMTGIYSVCKPQGYPVVCFLDADGKEGGLYCLPLQEVGGVCH